MTTTSRGWQPNGKSPLHTSFSKVHFAQPAPLRTTWWRIFDNSNTACQSAIFLTPGHRNTRRRSDAMTKISTTALSHLQWDGDILTRLLINSFQLAYKFFSFSIDLNLWSHSWQLMTFRRAGLRRPLLAWITPSISIKTFQRRQDMIIENSEKNGHTTDVPWDSANMRIRRICYYINHLTVISPKMSLVNHNNGFSTRAEQGFSWECCDH